MTTTGVIGLYVETHNWGKTVALWQQLGFRLDFETDHHSGQLTHPAGGPYVFVAEVGSDQPLGGHPIVGVADASTFELPAAATVSREFEPQHWGVVEAMLADPDGRELSLQAPLPAGMSAPPGH